VLAVLGGLVAFRRRREPGTEALVGATVPPSPPPPQAKAAEPEEGEQ